MKTKLLALLVSSRPISWVNTAYPFAAGYLLTVQKIDAIFIIGTVFFLIPYNLLMYGINDVFDYESDQNNPRKGGIEGAVLERTQHNFTLVAAALFSLPFVIYLLLNSVWPVGGITLLIVVGLVLAYSLPVLRFKERPFVDSMTSSAHFVGPLVYALTFTTFQADYWYVIAAFFLWGMASHAFGAVQDIIPDRKGHINSIATVMGARWTTRFAIGLYLLSALLLMHFGWLGAIVAATELLYVINIWPFRSITDDKAEKANAGWRRFIGINWLAGFVVTLVLIYGFLY